VTIETLHPDLSVPARLDDLCQSIRIVLVRLVYLAAHSRLCMPRIKAHHRKAHSLQRVPMPGRQGAAFEPAASGRAQR
jgi:hypothetical protein